MQVGSGGRGGGGKSSLLPPRVWGSNEDFPPKKVELLNKYFNLREIKAFAEFYNDLLLSKSSTKKKITPKMVKDKMQSIQQVEFKNVKILNGLYAVNVTGISSDDMLHFLYWKYGCIPPESDGVQMHDALYSNYSSKKDNLDQDPNKVKHNIFISPEWLIELEQASRNKIVEQQVFPSLGTLKQDNIENIRQFLNGSREKKYKSMKDFLVKKYHWKSEKPEQKYFSVTDRVRALKGLTPRTRTTST